LRDVRLFDRLAASLSAYASNSCHGPGKQFNEFFEREEGKGHLVAEIQQFEAVALAARPPRATCAPLPPARRLAKYVAEPSFFRRPCAGLPFSAAVPLQRRLDGGGRRLHQPINRRRRPIRAYQEYK
jgi:hypothetical protein